MKKFIAGSFALCFLCANVFAGENLMLNGGFEKNKKLVSWGKKIVKNSGGKAPEIAIDSTEKKEGVQSLKVVTHGERDITVLVASPVPVSKGKTYIISCWIKNEGCSFSLRQDLINSSGHHIRERYKVNIKADGRFDWKYFETKVGIKKGEEKLGFTFFAGKKPGTIWLDDFRIEEAEVPPGDEVTFRMTPNYYTDGNVYWLPQNDPMIVFLTASNEAQHISENPRIIIELPEGVELVGCEYDSSEFAPPEKAVIDGKPYTRYDYNMGVPGIILRNVDFSSTAFGSVAIMLKAVAPPGNENLRAFIYFKDEKITCRKCPFDLKVMPLLQKARTPKIFETGISAGTSLEFFGKPLKQWIPFYEKCGFNEITLMDYLRAGSRNNSKHNRNPEPIIEEFNKAGVPVYNNTGCLVNGYMVRYLPFSGKIPDSVFIKRANGTIAKNTFDPAYIYRRGEWYVKAVNYVLDQGIKRGFDHLWCNWEPYMYRLANGSFTKLSLEDFAKFSGIPYDKIAAMNPLEIPKKYSDELMRFQSWQFEKSMEALNDIVNEKSRRTGKKINLLVCVGPNFLDYFAKGKKYWEYTGCFRTKDFLKHFDRISSWHYLYYTGRHMLDRKDKRLVELGYRQGELGVLENRTHRETLDQVEKKVSFIKKICADDKRKPVPYIHLSQNLQCNDWVVKPEAIGLQMLAAFIGGASGIQLYYFPMGYDGRYWKSAAEANNKIALFEDYVMKGQKLKSGFEIIPLTKLFKDKGYKQNLTWRAFKKDGKILLALCNFDFLDPAVFALKAKKDIAVGAYVAHDPIKKEYFVFYEKDAVLSVPPMTVRFWVIEPSSKGVDYGRKLNTDLQPGVVEKLNANYEKRMKEIEELTNHKEDKLPDYSKIKKMQAEPFSVRKIEKDGNVFYRISNCLQSLTLLLNKGACVKEWRIYNAPEISMLTDVPFAFFCKERFYHPKGYMGDSEVLKPYEFVSHSVKGGELRAVFKRTVKDGELAGLTITKTYVVPKEKTGFSVEYELSSSSEEGRTVGLWIFNAPSMISEINKTAPEIEIGGKKYKDFLRKVSVYKMDDSGISDGFEKALFKYFGHEYDLFKTAYSPAVLSNANGTLEVNPGKTDFYAYLSWPFSKKVQAATFELIYNPVKVSKSKTWKTAIVFEPEIKRSIPESVTVQSGDLELRFDLRKAYNINRIYFDGGKIGLDRTASHYGTVLGFPEFDGPLGGVGSGHTELDSEKILKAEFFSDGKKLSYEDLKKTVKADDFMLKMETFIKGVRLNKSFEVKDDVATQEVDVSTEDKIPLKLIYHFMMPWTPDMKEYMVKSADGKILSGTFDVKDKTLANVKMDWAALYDPMEKTAVVSVLLESPEEDGSAKMFLCNVPQYKKFYFHSFPRKSLPEKFRGKYRMATILFKADENTWKSKAEEAAGKIKKNFQQ